MRRKGLIGKIIVLALVVVSSVIIIGNINSVVKESKTTQSVTDAKQVLKTIDTVINQLAYEGEGAQRRIDVNLPDGKLIFSGKDDQIKIRLENTDLLKAGTRIVDENIIIQGGGSLDLYIEDVLDDDQQDYVMENSAVMLAIKKLGSVDNYTFINTSSIITQIRNKVTGINITPTRSGIFVNDNANSSYGYGYTDMTKVVNAQTGSINVHVNSTYAVYDAVFTMAAASDFFTLEVKNLEIK